MILQLMEIKFQIIHAVTFQYSVLGLLLIFLLELRTIHAAISVTPLTVDTDINIQIQLAQFGMTGTTGSTIQLELPPQFSADELRSNMPYSGYDSTAGDSCPANFLCPGVTVSYSGGYVFTINGVFPSDQILFVFYTIKGIKSPDVAITTSGFQLRVLDSSKAVLHSQTPTGITFTPKTISCSGSISINKMVSTESTASFTISPTTQPIDDPTNSVRLTFPKPWQNEQIIEPTLINDVSCVSSTHERATCQKSNQNVIVSNIDYKPTIQIDLQSVLNPSSVMDAGTIVIKTISKSNKQINQCEVTLSGFEPDAIRAGSLNIDYTSDTKLQLDFSFEIRKSIQAGTKIKLELPNQINLNGASFLVTRASVLLNPSVITYDLVNNHLDINPFVSSTANNVIEISCLNVNRPRTALLLSKIKISTFFNNKLMAFRECCSKFLSPRQTLVVASPITIDKPYFLSTAVQYTFIITKNPSLTYLTTDKIMIIFPSKYSIADGAIPCTVSASSAAVNPSPSCTSNKNTIQINNVLTSDYSSASDFTFKIQGINNPAADPSSDPFLILVLSNSEEIIERNSATYVSISEAIISALSVTASSYKTYDNNVELTFQFNTNGKMQKLYLVQLLIPVEVSIDESILSCKINAGVCSCWAVDSSTIRIQIVSTQTSVSTTLKVSGFTNPKSEQPTGNFHINIFDEMENKLEKTDPSLTTTLTMLTFSTFQTVSASLSTDKEIYTSTSLDIIAVPPFAATSDINIFVVQYLASQIKVDLGATTACAGCTIAGTKITKNIATGTSVIKISITNIGVTRTITETPPTLTIRFYQTGDHLAIESTATIIQNLLPLNIDYSLSQSSWVMGEGTDITMTYSVSSDVSPSISYLSIKIPEQYSAPSLTQNKYKYTAMSGTININSIATNPSLPESSQFFIYAFSSTDQIIAISSSNNKKFGIVCTLPCRTCTTPKTNCDSCYSSSHQNKLIVILGNGQCVSQCPQKYYLKTTTIQQCLPCDSNCENCALTSPTQCLTCPVNQYLHFVDDKCYSDCPIGFFNDNKWCTACPSVCLQCDSMNYCTSCEPSLYLFNNLCVISCPPSTYQSTAPLRCTDCPVTNCLHCSDTQCLKCSSNYFLYNNVCYDQCPNPLLPNKEQSCTNCECKTCSQYSYKCTSCLSIKPYLYQSSCYLNCPDGFAPDTSNICQPCPTNCAKCSSVTYCTLCQQNYAKIEISPTNANCVTDCPPSTHILTLSADSDFQLACEPCKSPCLTCDISVSFCLNCVASYAFHNNTCVTSCPTGLHSIGGICKLCVLKCQNCTSDPHHCTECQPNYYLYERTCFSACPSKTYASPLGKQCQQCHNLCSECQNSTNCTSCVNGYYLFNNFCYVDCPTVPIKYYRYEGLCQLCQPQCTSCLSTPLQCTSCSSTQYYYHIQTKQCVFHCEQPFYKKDRKCVRCQQPCASCDKSWEICATCINSYYLYEGKCLLECPIGYYTSLQVLNQTEEDITNLTDLTVGVCQQCPFPCFTCMENQCIKCQNFAFLYKTTCVLECPSEVPFQQNGYCSNCLGVGLCAICGETESGNKICNQCVYPYVLFEGTCLNQCPQNYTIDAGAQDQKCIQSQQYKLYLEELAARNTPNLPPMLFLIIYVILILVFYLITKKVYKYTYHTGYFIALLTLIQVCCLYYFIWNIGFKYHGQYSHYNQLFLAQQSPIALLHSSNFPLFLLFADIAINSIIILFLFYVLVLGKIYYRDIRYHQYVHNFRAYWWIFVFLMPALGGHRVHKINYSKLFGFRFFAYRIVSVSKFQTQDYLTHATILGDLSTLAAAAMVISNTTLTHHILIYSGYEIICLKVILWILLYWDMKKPDRGFFMGDQQQAQEQIERQLEEEEKRLKRVDTQNLAKLIRTKSAGQLATNKMFGEIFIEDFRSVYNPDDYEDVPVVPLKKIERNLYKGKFRKGNKISIEQKLNKFIDTIKPRKKNREDPYLKDLLYWRPPKPIKVKPPVKPSQESMMELLNRKEFEYKEEIQEAEFEEYKKKQHYIRPKYNEQLYIEDIDETIPNETMELFYPSQSIQTHPFKDSSIEYDDLMNLNYARKKHLNKGQTKERQESMRILHHNPKKHRRNPRYGFRQQ